LEEEATEEQDSEGHNSKAFFICAIGSSRTSVVPEPELHIVEEGEGFELEGLESLGRWGKPRLSRRWW
jgi:hypothetical protein